MAAVAAILAAALASQSCRPAFDVGSLEARYGGLAEVSGHRLADLHPYVWPAAGELVAFLCRWPTAARLRVALPGDAAPAELDLWRRALSAWEGAGTGLRFVPVASDAAADVSLSMAGAEAGRAAQTAADCAVDAAARADRSGDAIGAHLVAAHVRVSRAALDWRGHTEPLAEDELLGTMLHELGHALGFQGHARRGSVMVRDVEAVRRIGARVLAGEPFDDATLRALYRVDSGAVVLRRRLDAGETAIVDRITAQASARGFTGPLVRVGDRAGWIAWRHADGRRVSLGVRHLPETLRGERPLALAPDRIALGWMAERRAPRGR